MIERRELTIAIVCYPSLGGSGIIARELALGLAQRGHKLHVVASAPLGRGLPPSARVSFHQLDAPGYPLFAQTPYTLPLAAKLAAVARAERVDLVHVHYAVPHAASAYLARQVLGDHAPILVTTLHGTDVTRVGADPSYRAITRFCVEASDAITVPSAFLREQAHQLLGIGTGRPIEVIANFVDTDQFAPPETREPARFAELFEGGAGAPAGAREPLLLHASNFRSVKRVTDLLEVLARVRRRVPARLLLVGDGPDRPAALARARSLGVQHSVCFLGERSEFVELLRHADAFLLTSESESFGLAALEALSCGVPVLGYRVGGVPAVVSEDVGRLVAPLDLDALAEAVVAVVSDLALRDRLGAQARARVLANFARAPALDAYEQLYRRALASPRRQGA